MEIESLYKTWLKKVQIPELRRELIKIKENKEEIYDRFYKSLEFGTAGLRAIMAAGTNRINVYTIRKATQGFANYLNEKFNKPSIAVCYDSRKRSKMFAYEVASVMAANNIKVHIVNKLSPTPFLSFMIRRLKLNGGVMITASHNTAKYNGYKCYCEDGSQINEKIANEIYEKILNVDIFEGVKYIKTQDALENGTISFINQDIQKEYITFVTNHKIRNIDLSALSVVYTPLNGCGLETVCKSLKSVGIEKLIIPAKQKLPNGNFTTCKYPNPETPQAFDLSLKEAEKVKADIIIATDPDADRLGICVRHKNEYKILNGNQIGILLFYYIIKNKKEYQNLSFKPVAIKTIVSSKMINTIAKKEHCDVIEVLTGFKNIAKAMSDLEKKGQIARYIFGFEESNGYLCSPYVRDKDSVSAAVLMCEVVAYFKSINLSLIDALLKLKEKYGYYEEKTLSFDLTSSKDKEKVNKIISYFKEKTPKFLGKYEIIGLKNYENLGSKNVISLDLSDETEIIIRPSGTEPKLKAYILAHSKDNVSVCEKIKILSESIEKIINNF